jgi:hypothetical protein
MKAAQGNRWSLRAPLYLVALAGVAFSVSGCIIDGSTSPPPTCTPDLYVNWRIVESGTGAILNCEDVPATTIRVTISGQTTDFACPVGHSTGSIPFFLDVTGTYTVGVQLFNGSSLLSGTSGADSIFVDCSGLTSTPLIDLEVI